MKCESGFTIIEILIVIVLGFLIGVVVLRSYSITKDIYRSENNLAISSENIRLVDLFLWQNIMSAGFAGCRSLPDLDVAYLGDPAKKISSVRGYPSNNLPEYLSRKRVKKETDVLVVYKAGPVAAKLARPAASGARSFKLELPHPFADTDYHLLIADCKNADVVKVDNYVGDIVYINRGLQHSYNHENSEVRAFEEKTFFIRKSSHKDESGKFFYGLFFSTNPEKPAEELAIGINTMKIFCRTSDRGDYFSTGEMQANNLWGKVTGVLVNLEVGLGRFIKTKKLYVHMRGKG